MALTLSVIVCAHNEAQYISTCLYSLLAQSRLPDEILVVNNASTDETPAVFTLLFPNLERTVTPGRYDGLLAALS